MTRKDSTTSIGSIVLNTESKNENENNDNNNNDDDGDEALLVNFLASNEQEIKSIFPATATHTSNVDFLLMHSSLQRIGFHIETIDDLVKILAFLHDEGFFSYVNDYQIVVNNEPLYLMEWEA